MLQHDVGQSRCLGMLMRLILLLLEAAIGVQRPEEYVNVKIGSGSLAVLNQWGEHVGFQWHYVIFNDFRIVVCIILIWIVQGLFNVISSALFKCFVMLMIF